MTDSNDTNENVERTSQNSARIEKEYEVSADELSRSVMKAVSRLPKWSVEDEDSGNDDSNKDEVHAIRTTRLFRFKDDISINISDTPAGAKLVADSESRLGKSDLGQNPRNLDELLEAIDDALSETRRGE